MHGPGPPPTRFACTHTPRCQTPQRCWPGGQIHRNLIFPQPRFTMHDENVSPRRTISQTDVRDFALMSPSRADSVRSTSRHSSVRTPSIYSQREFSTPDLLRRPRSKWLPSTYSIQELSDDGRSSQQSTHQTHPSTAGRSCKSSYSRALRSV